MPNCDTHIKIGLTTGALVGGAINGLEQWYEIKNDITKKFDYLEFFSITVLGSLMGGFTAMIPDILEPATNPNHRQFFHSFTTYGLLTYGSCKLDQCTLEPNEKLLFQCAISGYLSHLLADSTTPKSLNII